MTLNSTPSPPDEIVREILRDWDPEGLIEMGLPENEYEPEADRICDHLEDVQNREDTVDLIRAVFSHMFGREYSWSECEEVWKRLYRKLEKD